MSSLDNKEIEKKYKVADATIPFRSKVLEEIEIFQAYFVDSDGENKRIRIQPTQKRAIVTQKKDLGVKDGVPIREEIEFDIDFQKGLKTFLACDVFIHKTRYVMPFVEHFKFEFDIYRNLNFTLNTVEVEMKMDEIEHFNTLVLPSWVGEDISLEKKFSNFSLTKDVDKSIVLPMEMNLLRLRSIKVGPK